MKRVIGYLLFLLAGALVLMGCGGETAVSTPSPTAAPPAPESTATEVAIEEEAAADTAVSTSPHDPTNLTLIGSTGRPQFLNTYASW